MKKWFSLICFFIIALQLCSLLLLKLNSWLQKFDLPDPSWWYLFFLIPLICFWNCFTHIPVSGYYQDEEGYDHYDSALDNRGDCFFSFLLGAFVGIGLTNSYLSFLLR